MARYQKQRNDERIMHGKFELIIINEPDYDHEPPRVMAQNYTDCTLEEIAEYCRQDQERVDAYNREEWCYLQLGVELRVQNRMNWAVWTTVGRAYLAGVESDSEQSYINGEIDLLKHEAEADAEATFQALKAIFEPQEVPHAH